MTIEIGLPIPQSSMQALDMARLRNYLMKSDALGFDSLWVTEQLFGPGPRLAPVALLSFAAALTSRAKLGTGILQIALRSPALLAKTTSTLDHLSGGRLIMGVAAGSDPASYRACGLSSERTGAQLEQAVELLRRFWTEDGVSHDDGRLEILDASINPKPVQKPHPPIWFGGSSRIALKRAARLGTGWMGAGAAPNARYLSEMTMMRELAAEAGHAPGAFKVGKRVYIAVDSDTARAQFRLREWFGTTYPGRDPSAVDVLAVSGRPEDCLDQLGSFLESKPDYVVLNPVFDELEQLDVIAEALVPGIRGARR
ncbi:LLM class flavin-dependent oxidoreductase [Hoeflea sp. CAU 1731]